MEAQAEELARTTVAAYKSILATIAQAGGKATPHLGAGLLEKLGSFQESLTPLITPDQMSAAQQAVNLELESWGESAAKYSEDKEKEIRDIMVAVALSAEALGERDERYATQFS